MATQAGWKPDRAEAQFLGELLNVDVDIAKRSRDLLAEGHSLDEVVALLKVAVQVAAPLRGEAA